MKKFQLVTRKSLDVCVWQKPTAQVQKFKVLQKPTRLLADTKFKIRLPEREASVLVPAVCFAAALPGQAASAHGIADSMLLWSCGSTAGAGCFGTRNCGWQLLWPYGRITGGRLLQRCACSLAYFSGFAPAFSCAISRACLKRLFFFGGAASACLPCSPRTLRT